VPHDKPLDAAQVVALTARLNCISALYAEIRDAKFFNTVVSEWAQQQVLKCEANARELRRAMVQGSALRIRDCNPNAN